MTFRYQRSRRRAGYCRIIECAGITERGILRSDNASAMCRQRDSRQLCICAGHLLFANILSDKSIHHNEASFDKWQQIWRNLKTIINVSLLEIKLFWRDCAGCARKRASGA